jgi:hypothetical protein
LGYSTAEDFLLNYERQTRTVNRIFEAYFSESNGRLAGGREEIRIVPFSVVCILDNPPRQVHTAAKQFVTVAC